MVVIPFHNNGMDLNFHGMMSVLGDPHLDYKIPLGKHNVTNSVAYLKSTLKSYKQKSMDSVRFRKFFLQS